MFGIDINTMKIAEGLYDGGWRAKDRDDLKAYYELTDEQVDDNRDALEWIEDYDE